MTNEFYMQLALNKAWEYQGLTYPNPAVGAVITHNGKILAIEAHQKAGTSHAEVLALCRSYEVLTSNVLGFDILDAHKAHAFLHTLPPSFFSKCHIYVTLEPCSHIGETPSCSNLLEVLNLEKVLIGTRDIIEGHDGGLDRLNNTVLGVLEKECKDLIEPFMIWQNRAFVLFKLAQTTNGRIGDGYLSSEESLIHVHKLREVCSYILIGGNTVRIDRPTLDCRFIESKAADVKIYTQNNNFDNNISLFSVPNRNVDIVHTIECLDTPSFVLVEGGAGMLEALKGKIDWLLIYQTPKLSSHTLTYNTTMNLELVYQNKKDVDLMIWSKNSGN